MSNNTGTPVGLAATPWCISELLCFVTDKCNILPVDDLVKICVDFYFESEIINARSAVDSTGVRLPKRNRSSDRLRLTMEDIVKCVRSISSVARVPCEEFVPASRQWMSRTVMSLRYCWSSAHCAQRSGSSVGQIAVTVLKQEVKVI